MNGSDPGQGEERDGHRRDQKGREKIEGLDLFDVQDAQARAQDQHAAYQRDLGQQLRRQIGGDEIGQQVDGALPAEEDCGGQGDAQTEGGGEHNGGDAVQDGVGEEVGVVAVEGTLDGAQDGQSAGAVEQDGGGKAFGQVGAVRETGHQRVKGGVQMQAGTDEPAQRQTDDKEDVVFALRHGADNGIDAKCCGSQAHGVHHHILITFSDPLFQGAAHQTAHKNGAGVGNGSDHVEFLLCDKISWEEHKPSSSWRVKKVLKQKRPPSGGLF